jgi:hypothetical protein
MVSAWAAAFMGRELVGTDPDADAAADDWARTGGARRTKGETRSKINMTGRSIVRVILAR